jgi:hypothetical protein
MSHEMLPCPFCGAAAAVLVERTPGQFKVFCDNGPCSVSTAVWGGRQPAIAAWNKRAPSPSHEAEHRVITAALFHHERLLAIAIDMKDERLHVAARIAGERLADAVVAYKRLLTAQPRKPDPCGFPNRHNNPAFPDGCPECQPKPGPIELGQHGQLRKNRLEPEGGDR